MADDQPATNEVSKPPVDVKKFMPELLKQLKEKHIVTIQAIISHFDIDKQDADLILREFYQKFEQQTQGVFIITIISLDKLITMVCTSDELELVNDKVISLYLIAVRLTKPEEVKYSEVMPAPPKLPQVIYEKGSKPDNSKTPAQTPSASMEKEVYDRNDCSYKRKRILDETKLYSSEDDDDERPSSTTRGMAELKKKRAQSQKTSEHTYTRAASSKDFKPPVIEGFVRPPQPLDKSLQKPKTNERVQSFEYDEGGHSERKSWGVLRPAPPQTNKAPPQQHLGTFSVPVKNASITSFFKKAGN
jgi:hypothetical protein